MEDQQGPAHPEWGERLARYRRQRGWSQVDAVAALRRTIREQGGSEPSSADTLVRSWKRWEQGYGPSLANQQHVATLFNSVPGAMFPPAARQVLATTDDTTELLERFQASSLDTSALDSLALTVETLCSDYARAPAEQLRTEGRAWLARLVEARNKPLTLTQHREVQVQTGWLALLLACVEHDVGNARTAREIRLRALSIGREAGHAGIQGWAHEIAAWQAVTSGNLRGVLKAADAGLAVAGGESVAVQLWAQKAKALVRMGANDDALAALERGRLLLEAEPYPDNVDNHFTVDPPKWTFYAMGVFCLSSDDAAAEHLAHEVLRDATDPAGVPRQVMRASEARLTLAVLQARRGDVDGAVHWGHQALDEQRRSLPGLLMSSRNLVGNLRQVAPDASAVAEFSDRVTALQPHRS